MEEKILEAINKNPELKELIKFVIVETKKQIIEELKADLYYAEQDKEMAEDPMDPKVRIAWFKHKLDQKLKFL